MISRTCPTKEGRIAILEGPGRGDPPCLLFLHGNSSCKEVFQRQLDSDLSESFHLIAVDLPGHGQSDPARNPQQTYTASGYATVIKELIEQLGLSKLVIIGWSLGGAIALELFDQLPQLRGIFLTGSPPTELSHEGFQRAFRPLDPEILQSFSSRTLSEAQAVHFAKGGGYDGTEETRWALEAVKRCDGLARECFAQAIQDNRAGRDGARIVETSEVPIAVVGGEDDYLINWDYVRSLKYKKLWRNKVYLLPGLTHCLMLEDPVRFNALVARFSEEVMV